MTSLSEGKIRDADESGLFLAGEKGVPFTT